MIEIGLFFHLPNFLPFFESELFHLASVGAQVSVDEHRRDCHTNSFLFECVIGFCTPTLPG